jgi:phosphoesterase RecJ-like protein
MLNKFGYDFSEEEVSGFKTKVLAASHIAILPHSRADGDALGSASGLQLALKTLGISSEIICPDLPKVKMVCQYEIAKFTKKPDLLISVDCASKERCFLPVEFDQIFFLNIDHHISNTLFADLNIVKNAPSACEVLTALLSLAFGDEVFDKQVAEALLFGVMSDTLIFSTSEVAIQSFQITEFLLSFKVDYQKVKSNVQSFIPVKNFKNWADIILKAEVFLEGKVFVLKLTKNLIVQLNVVQNDFAGFINYVASNVDSEVVVFISEFEDKCIDVSIRSKKANVNLIAQDFLGGGHKKASGFKVKNKKLAILEEDLLKKIAEELMSIL